MSTPLENLFNVLLMVYEPIYQGLLNTGRTQVATISATMTEARAQKIIERYRNEGYECDASIVPVQPRNAIRRRVATA